MTATSHERPRPDTEFQWKPFPETDLMIRQLVDDFCESCAFASELRDRMLVETGTRLTDWIDHIAVNIETELNGGLFRDELAGFGFEHHSETREEVFTHQAGRFPAIRLTPSDRRRLVIKVDSIVDFLTAQQMDGVPIEGDRFARIRKALICQEVDCEFWVCERTGYTPWEVEHTDESIRLNLVKHYDQFCLRQRCWEDEASGLEETKRILDDAIQDVGINSACDLFFAAERRYWQTRNRAATTQKQRQDRLGLGWSNHDHHTYRSSRKHFSDLIDILELLGFHCRERFYAGRDAGWGAQVLEQSDCGIVIFADVDLDPSEMSGDFAHDGLAERDELGTVGLWCQLHGEAILQAGMHHLECTFDFDEAVSQLKREGIETMSPFTDSPVLRQAFTAGEVWPVDKKRVEQAQNRGLLTSDQAAVFLREGAIGSHLEILERNEGFKGFNQDGVSSIIAKTDPRKTR